MNEFTWDVFISHASEDKEEVVLPLAKLLLNSGLTVWLDKGEMFLGDSLREKIDEGLACSQFGIVVFSHSFFSKNWPKLELDGLFSREIDGEKVILPIWHNVGIAEIKDYSPLIAGKLAVRTNIGLDEVKNRILSTIHKVGRKESIAKPIYSGTLTKAKIMVLPEGSYLISNCYDFYDKKPLIEAVVGSLEDRDTLWEQAKLCGANGRLCRVFKRYEDYRAHIRMLDSLMQLE